MKYLIITDIHGSSDSFKRVWELACKILPEKIIFLGDIVTQSADASFFKEILGLISCPVEMVTGNCESMYLLETLPIGNLGDFDIINIKGRNYFFTHGHRYSYSNLPPILKQGDVFIQGHLHINGFYNNHGINCVVLGSPSRPRDDIRPFGLLTDDGFSVFDFDSEELIMTTKFV